MLDTADIIDQTVPARKQAGTPPLFDVDGDGLPDTVEEFNSSCGFGAIRRRFRQGSTTICEQWFVIEPIDMFDPSTIEFPGDMVVDCRDFDAGEPTWEEAVCNLVGVTLESDTFPFSSGACFEVVNRWSIIDWCTYDPTNPTGGGRFEGIQTIRVIDTVDPVVTVPDALCFAVNEECTSKGVVLTGSAIDNGDCASPTINWEVIIDAFSDNIEDFRYSTASPILVDGEPNLFHIPASASGDEISIVLPDGIASSKTFHTAIWRAIDGCNNVSSVTVTFQIVDKKAPTPVCLNLGSAVMDNGQVELWAIDFNTKSFDNCTDEDVLFYTFTVYHHHQDVMLSICLLYTSPSPRDRTRSRMPSSA